MLTRSQEERTNRTHLPTRTNQPRHTCPNQKDEEEELLDGTPETAAARATTTDTVVATREIDTTPAPHTLSPYTLYPPP